MNKNLFFSILFCSTLLLLGSCKKGGAAVAEKTTYQLTSVVITQQGQDTATYTFDYDSKGRVETMFVLYQGSTTQRNFQYNANYILMTSLMDGIYPNTDSIALNSMGLATSILHKVNGTPGELQTFEYSEDGQLIQSSGQYLPGGQVTTTGYSYTGGDMTGQGGMPSYYTYVATQPSASGGYWEASQIVQYGGNYIYRNTHILNSIGTTYLTYTYDGDGNISTMAIPETGSAQVFHYTYQKI